MFPAPSLDRTPLARVEAALRHRLPPRIFGEVASIRGMELRATGLRLWRAPTEWSSLNVNALPASGPFACIPLVPVVGSSEHCAA